MISFFPSSSDPYHALYRWYKSSTASEGEGDDDAKPYPTFRLNLGFLLSLYNLLSLYFMRMLFCLFLYGLIIVAVFDDIKRMCDSRR
uniref:Uncharacterized protein n=1 Tax=Brassica oleracea var. oleracea TaxID=109376 RepID=A0A0D3DXB7_BRAOL